jgi:dienelactone hydrolase
MAAGAADFGDDGPFGVTVDSIAGPTRRQGRIFLFRPDTSLGRVPVVFFLCGVGPNAVRGYAHIGRHLATRGYCVVMPSFRLASFPWQHRTYRRLRQSLDRAVDAWKGRFDTTRVGFAGHSFGAGAIPYLAPPLLVQRGWGSHGSLIMAMAPFYVFRTSQDDLRAFPPNVKMIVQVYADDDCNDHRVAIDLFENIGIPPENKRYTIVRTDSNGGRVLNSHHGLPFGAGAQYGEHDLYDTVAVYRPLDALAGYVFGGEDDARDVAFGKGEDARWMGRWPDGRAVRPLDIEDHPEPELPARASYFNWSHPWNPRKRSSPSFDPRGQRRQ